jgi:hypothetical protein
MERGQQLLGLGDVHVANPEMHPAILDIHGCCASSSASLCVGSPCWRCSHIAICARATKARSILLICNELNNSQGTKAFEADHAGPENRFTLQQVASGNAIQE